MFYRNTLLSVFYKSATIGLINVYVKHNRLDCCFTIHGCLPALLHRPNGLFGHGAPGAATNHILPGMGYTTNSVSVPPPAEFGHCCVQKNFAPREAHNTNPRMLACLLSCPGPMGCIPHVFPFPRALYWTVTYQNTGPMGLQPTTICPAWATLQPRHP